ncbi:hypothetical protein GCM10028784_20110 [Myceligenerans cantabricum]
MFRTRDLWRENAPDVDTSPMTIVALVKGASAMFERALEPLFDGTSVSPPELDMLIVLRHTPGRMIARHLADEMRISRPAVGKTLAKLEGRGLVERARSPTDGRAQLVTVTDAGKRIVDTLFPRQLAIEADLLAGLGEDRARVIDALNTLVTAMASRSAHPGNH